jgi:hypothetical protein
MSSPTGAGWVFVLVLALALSAGPACCQQLAFTSRTYLQSPVVISSVEASKEFGFDSVVLRNDGPEPVTAVHFLLTYRAGSGDEVVDERRFDVSLEPRDSKRLPIGLAHIEGLKQQARSRKHQAALVILTIESVEFQGGGEWKQMERGGGIAIDPADTPLQKK